MKKNNTYFVDIDGTIFVYRKFETYKETDVEVIKSTKQYLQQVKDNGHMIILTTARPEDSLSALAFNSAISCYIYCNCPFTGIIWIHVIY